MNEKEIDPKDDDQPIDPAPWLGPVGDGATLPSGEIIAREIRELTEKSPAERHKNVSDPRRSRS